MMLQTDEIIDKDEVLKMARQVGFDEGLILNVYPNFIQRFAKLVADAATAKEREVCAKAFELYWNDAGIQRDYSPTEYINSMRSRGEA